MFLKRGAVAGAVVMSPPPPAPRFPAGRHQQTRRRLSVRIHALPRETLALATLTLDFTALQAVSAVNMAILAVRLEVPAKKVIEDTKIQANAQAFQSKESFVTKNHILIMTRTAKI